MGSCRTRSRLGLTSRSGPSLPRSPARRHSRPRLHPPHGSISLGSVLEDTFSCTRHSSLFLQRQIAFPLSDLLWPSLAQPLPPGDCFVSGGFLSLRGHAMCPRRLSLGVNLPALRVTMTAQHSGLSTHQQVRAQGRSPLFCPAARERGSACRSRRRCHHPAASFPPAGPSSARTPEQSFRTGKWPCPSPLLHVGLGTSPNGFQPQRPPRCVVCSRNTSKI